MSGLLASALDAILSFPRHVGLEFVPFGAPAEARSRRLLYKEDPMRHFKVIAKSSCCVLLVFLVSCGTAHDQDEKYY